MKKCVIIMNPESGKKKKIKTYQEFYDVLRKYGYSTEIIFTKSKGDAKNIIQVLDDNIDLVVSAGGDGTLNEIVSGNMKRTKKLNIAPLPLGSTNDVGMMYGLNKNVLTNLETLLQGEIKKVDICYINNTPFVYVAAFGDYTDLSYLTPRELKKKYGKIAYILYGIKHLRNKIKRYNIKYKVDGQTHTGTYSFIFITNSSRVAGQSEVYHDVKLNDNMFEVAMADVKTKAEMLKMIVLINTMDIKDISEITYYRTNNFEIEFLDGVNNSWCIDGEEFKTPEAKFTFSVEQSMKMLVPKGKVKKLFKD